MEKWEGGIVGQPVRDSGKVGQPGQGKWEGGIVGTIISMIIVDFTKTTYSVQEFS